MDQEWDVRCGRKLLEAIESEEDLLSVAIEYSLEQLRLDMDRSIAESIADEWQEEIKHNYSKAVGSGLRDPTRL